MAVFGRRKRTQREARAVQAARSHEQTCRPSPCGAQNTTLGRAIRVRSCTANPSAKTQIARAVPDPMDSNAAVRSAPACGKVRKAQAQVPSHRLAVGSLELLAGMLRVGDQCRLWDFEVRCRSDWMPQELTISNRRSCFGIVDDEIPDPPSVLWHLPSEHRHDAHRGRRLSSRDKLVRRAAHRLCVFHEPSRPAAARARGGGHALAFRNELRVIGFPGCGAARRRDRSASLGERRCRRDRHGGCVRAHRGRAGRALVRSRVRRRRLSRSPRGHGQRTVRGRGGGAPAARPRDGRPARPDSGQSRLPCERHP
jgi:hypothetical protein